MNMITNLVHYILDEHSTRTGLRSQLNEMFFSNSTSDNSALFQVLTQLIPEELQQEWLEWISDGEKRGVPEGFSDSLPRVATTHLSPDDTCAICCCVYLEDSYPLVVKLPNCNHKFDLQCITLWLSKSSTCPMCRNDVMSSKTKIDTSMVELEEDWGMYG
ncbi:uncharacterized protein Ecym_2658 [Eremothecium cymbalariae DBVPG|uniref:RING-type domain-containing protein n=1 Tax=Eremothecium cymbalariae (strain CBS 270.75 / DBVPG 7215 / KCTC 17166 / NRRL Y-17582) TaxID=931890 RepID=G8JNU4_ERECY|nr:Hypothetical protein Ecym_2658 [Eremothecium cymbalariae DBVPG\